MWQEHSRCVECLQVRTRPGQYCIAKDSLLCYFCCTDWRVSSHAANGHPDVWVINYGTAEEYGTAHACYAYREAEAAVQAGFDIYEPVEGLGALWNWDYCLDPRDGVTQHPVGAVVMQVKSSLEGLHTRDGWWVANQFDDPIIADRGTLRIGEPSKGKPDVIRTARPGVTRR